jgi:hypothetical protein
MSTIPALAAPLFGRLSADFTPEVKEAWTTVYRLLADTMKDGAVQAAG